MYKINILGYKFASPSFPLSLYVKQYWAIDDCLQTGDQHIQRIVPNGLMDLTFYLGNRPQAMDKSKHLQDNIILNGQLKSFYDILIPDKLSMLSISFQPFGAKIFFDIPASELYDLNIPLKYLIKSSFTELETKLHEACSFESRIRILENFLMNQLQKQNRDYEINRIAKTISLITQTRGQINIETLSSSACLSRKQYERVFSEYIGTSPKQFLRIIRFQRSLYEKQKNIKIALTDLAYICGYFDQSHMINDYKLLSGKTPTQYYAACEPYSDYFL